MKKSVASFGVKLHKSSDQGAHWTELTLPAYPPKPQDGPMAEDSTPWNVEMIWSLAAGNADQANTLWAGCMPAGLFKSEDAGQSWVLNRALWENPKRLAWVVA
ncbi:MAG: hypothetical protein PHH58_18215 [Rhodoferax sp.]|nr:hypothetical protein [Rhodoferax sp.]